MKQSYSNSLNTSTDKISKSQIKLKAPDIMMIMCNQPKISFHIRQKSEEPYLILNW